MKPTASFRPNLLRLLVLLTCGWPVCAALANPTGGNVVSGQAAMQTQGNTLTVTTASNKSIIDWQTFSIAPNETTRFVQPSSTSSVLNRVLANEPSVLLGSLQSNGKVFLINPYGILVGAGAHIDVAGFVASTLNISNQDFLNDTLNFQAALNAGRVDNQGSIRTPEGGSVYLIAPEVENSGIIQTPGGETILAAGRTVQLLDTATPGVKVEITGSDTSATNLGQIIADAGTIGMAGAMVRNSGTLNAGSVVQDGGRIFLRATQKIELTETSKLGADGISGGNIIAITSENDQISGEFVARGEISSQGNGTPGSGGFVETSATQVRIGDEFRVKTNGGEWLIDPSDFTITASGGNISGTALSANLGSGNVSILSSSGTTGGNGDINVNDAVSWSSNTLTLTAARDININAAMTATSSAGLTMNTAAANGADSAVAGGTVRVGFNPDGTFKGHVDLATGTSLTINGSPYTIINDLTALQNINGNLAGKYALGSNIVGAAFSPIGNSLTPFTGVFDGLGHTITGLSINQPSGSYVGLFGATNSAALRNAGLVNASVTGDEYIGGLVGSAVGTAVHNSYADVTLTGRRYLGGLIGNIDWESTSIPSTVDNSHSTGSVTGGVGGNATEVGGLIGSAYSRFGKETFITHSYSTASVTNNSTFSSKLGGLVGYLGESSSIADSYATGAITTGSQDGSLLGGLVGESYQSTTITRSYATGNITIGGFGNDIGGLVGNSWGDFGAGPSTISKSYSSGAISITGGGNQVGGLVGFNSQAISDSYALGSVSISGGGSNFEIGGLVGYNNYATIARSYATGAVSASGTPTFVGGLIGRSDGINNVSQSYWDIDTTDQATSAGTVGGVTGIWSSTPTVNAYTEATYAGFDFTNTWWMSAGNTRPFLRSEWGTNITNAHQLQLMAMNLSANYTLANNIDLAPALNAVGGKYPGMWGGAGFVQIGDGSSFTDSTRFTGIFDGLGHSITGLTINRPAENYIGLFGINKGTIQNVGLINASVTGNASVGALVGVGGVNSGGLVTKSYATGTVTGVDNVGGLVGQLNGGAVSYSYATTDVTGSSSVGGLVGVINAAAGGSVQNSYALGSVTGLGGATIGGLAGALNSVGTITNSYATGLLTTGGTKGGLVGSGTGAVTNSYWDTQTTGASSSSAGTGRTTAQMKDSINFTGWDFSNAWNIDSGATVSYPYLRINEQIPHPGLTILASTCSVCSWDGGGVDDFNWSLAANWLNDLLPTTGSTVTIGGGYGTTLFDFSSLSLAALTASSGLDILGTKTLTLTGDSTFNAPLTISSGGTINLNSGAHFLANGGSNSGTINLASGSSLDLIGNTFTLSGNSDIAGSGLFNIGGGTLAINAANRHIDNLKLTSGSINTGGSTNGLIVDNQFIWDHGTISGGGDFTVAGNATFANTVPGANAMLLSNQAITVNGNLAIDGQYWLDMTSGSLTVNGATTVNTSAASGFYGINSPASVSSVSFLGGLTKTAGAQAYDIANVNVTLDGTVQNQAGDDLVFDLGNRSATLSNTSFVADSGTLIKMASGNYSVLGTIAFSGAGTTHIGNSDSRTPVFTVGSGNLATNNGNLLFTSNATLTNTGTFINNGTLTSVPDFTLSGGGIYKGTGTLIGNLVNTSGIFAPGNSPGVTNITGNYTQGPSGTLEIELGGLAPGTGYDVLNVSGSASLGGTLNVFLFGGFLPSPGDSFTFINASDGVSGSFATLNLPSGYSFLTNYATNSFGLDLAAITSNSFSPPGSTFSQVLYALQSISGPFYGVTEINDTSISGTTHSPVILSSIQDLFIPADNPFAAGQSGTSDASSGGAGGFGFDAGAASSGRLPVATNMPFPLFYAQSLEEEERQPDGKVLRRPFGACSAGGSL